MKYFNPFPVLKSKEYIKKIKQIDKTYTENYIKTVQWEIYKDRSETYWLWLWFITALLFLSILFNIIFFILSKQSCL